MIAARKGIRLGQLGRIKRKRGTPESHVLRACLDLLKLRGILAWRSANGPRLFGDGHFAPSHTPGLPDILGVLPGGRMLACEVKAPGGKLSDSQQTFLRAIADMGGAAIVAYSADQLNEELNKWRVPCD